jgi:hypothetical protein
MNVDTDNRQQGRALLVAEGNTTVGRDVAAATPSPRHNHPFRGNDVGSEKKFVGVPRGTHEIYTQCLLHHS